MKLIVSVYLIHILNISTFLSLFLIFCLIFTILESHDLVRVSKTQKMMKAYCEEALKFGEGPVSKHSRLRQVTVILNPAANRRKAKDSFEKYCAPILNLAGFCVNVVQTEYEGHARKLVEETKDAIDAIVVASGDGTLSEVVTGLLRRPDGDIIMSKGFPIGVLPVGRTNSFGNLLFLHDNNTPKTLAEAAMAVVRWTTNPVDVMKIEPIEEENKKPIYALSGIQWGAYRDANVTKDKYWYFGSLRLYAAYFFGGMKSNLQWLCEAQLKYSLPCFGCSRCSCVSAHSKAPEVSANRGWLSRFLPKYGQSATNKSTNANVLTAVDYSKITNNECGKMYDRSISTVELCLTTNNNRHDADPPHLVLKLGPQTVSYIDFIKEGWSRTNNKMSKDVEELLVQEVQVIPTIEAETKDKECWFSIDNEAYELKPMNITLLPKKLHVFSTPKLSI